MITDIRVLENPNGTLRFQAFVIDGGGVDESGEVHACRSERDGWRDIPIIRYGQWSLNEDGEVVCSAPRRADSCTEPRRRKCQQRRQLKNSM